ncbi:glutathione S-transferase family protein [Bordetella petrii]|uniref:glutathione S-transferase family protein n=1 Tax=Bordetella petrii TaxID=94624 RepID=UPI001E49D367|nr:glutathione S-transferase family protein [Bordetella petrii]MCD0503626.1 glutathione S-transferase family protein [Bordetella petrii]
MTPILFYGVPSGCSFGAIVALEWLAHPYRLSRIQMPETVSGEAFRRINPVAETPAYASKAGAIITESMAILNHIAAHGLDQQLGYPQGSPGFDRLNQMLGYLNTSFFNAFTPLWHLVEHELDGPGRTVLAEYGRDKVLKAHATLDTLLGRQPWLLGEHRSVADAYFAGIARWADYHQVADRRDYPNLQRLYDTLQADPAVQFAHGIEAGQPAVSAGAFQGHIELADALALLER